MSTSCGRACGPSTVSSGWRLSGSSVVVPAVTTVPPSAMATPDTSRAAALPNAAVRRQEAPSAEVNAISAWPACLAGDHGPARGPLARPGRGAEAVAATNPAGVPRVASNVQAVPFAERYTSTAGLRATVAGRSRTNPSAVTATPLIWAWAPCPAGAPGGTASVQVVPPLPLSQAALVGALEVWPAAGATSPAMRIWFP